MLPRCYYDARGANIWLILAKMTFNSCLSWKWFQSPPVLVFCFSERNLFEPLKGLASEPKFLKLDQRNQKWRNLVPENFFGCMLVDHHDLFSPSTKCSFDPFIIFSSHSLFLLSSTFVSWIKNRVGWFDWEIRIADQRIKCNDTPALVFKST